jgi:hypothetical protein
VISLVLVVAAVAFGPDAKKSRPNAIVPILDMQVAVDNPKTASKKDVVWHPENAFDVTKDVVASIREVPIGKYEVVSVTLGAHPIIKTADGKGIEDNGKIFVTYGLKDLCFESETLRVQVIEEMINGKPREHHTGLVWEVQEKGQGIHFAVNKPDDIKDAVQ